MVCGLLDLPELRAVARRSLVPQAAAGVGGGLQPGPRRQRRAEDDGHHRRRAVCRRLAVGVPNRRCGWSWPRTRRSRSARCRAAGASFTRWGRRSRGCSRWAASRPRRPARSRSSPRPRSACRSSTTHTITGAIIGVGSTRRLSAVRWGVAGQIVWAWILTIPASAVIAARHVLCTCGDWRCRNASLRGTEYGSRGLRALSTAG